jgi:hypothetical protein
MKNLALAVAASLVFATPALAQRYQFDRSLDVSEAITLDVSTMRGKIEVSAGAAGRVVVAGAATVRVGWNVPSNAVQLAQKFSADFTIDRQGPMIRLRPPADADQRRAMTVDYHVTVPAQSTVITVSDSGETTIDGIGGLVTVRTQSGSIGLKNLGGAADVTSGSGAVVIDSVRGAVTVSTSSSGITARSIGGNLRARTSSGAVDASMSGAGAIDIETASSEIHVHDARQGLRTKTKSGRTIVRGMPGAAWDISTGSGSVEVFMGSEAAFRIEAMTGSGSVSLTGATVDGTAAKRSIAGVVRANGPLVRIDSRSGSINVQVGAR